MFNFFDYLEAQVNKAIYVWGGQGKNLSEMTQVQAEVWIRNREASRGSNSVSNTINADRAIALFRKRLEQGIDPILAFDCSGLIMYFLQNLVGEFDSDRTAKQLYSLCDYHPSKQELVAGDLVFKGGATNTISHVGVYVGEGKVIESFGRDVGVIKTDYSTGGWNFTGHLPQLDKYLKPDDEKHPIYSTVTSPLQRGEAYREMQEKLNKDGYTDADGNNLVVDGAWGKKSLAAFTKFMQYQEEIQ